MCFFRCKIDINNGNNGFSLFCYDKYNYCIILLFKLRL